MSNTDRIFGKLYDYQLEAIKSTDENLKGIVCMPTGTGKTMTEGFIIAKHIISNPGFGIYVINAPRIILSYQLLKEVYTLLVNSNIEARYMSVHSGGSVDLEDFEKIRIDANYNEGTNIKFSQIENGTSPILIREFVDKAKSQNLPLVIFSTYNSADRINDAVPNEKISIVVNDEAQYLVQEQFHDIIKILNSERCYFFTATTINTPSDKGRGMNNKDSYGDLIFNMTPREAIERGKMVRPRLHFVIPPTESLYNKDDFESSLGKIISDSFDQHSFAIGTFTNPKMLISVKGVGQIQKFFNSNEYKKLIRVGVRIYAVASDDRIGNNINGEKVSRLEFLRRLKIEGRDPSIKMIILHYDILSEGIDVPGITGIMPLRTLGKSKFLQTFGRAARLDPEDREKIENNEIRPNDLNDMIKPYAWIIVPTIIHEDEDSKEHIGLLINELRSWGFKPSEDIVSTDSKNGIKTIDGPEALNEIKYRCPDIGECIENVEADFESEYIASLSIEEKMAYIIDKIG